jgi:N6-L-threonylcarbamoyladenine synthase
MSNRKYIVGVDTSNYTTSVAAVDQNGHILFDQRMPIEVREGEKGIRQNEALFQHMQNVPDLTERLFLDLDPDDMLAAAASDRPRPLLSSYMPVFKAGLCFGKIMSQMKRLPYYKFSHQEGHIEAVRHQSVLAESNSFIAFHLSGGTSEILNVHINDDCYNIDIIGGTSDISFGQLLDRIGADLSIPFPSGASMDRMALAYSGSQSEIIKPVFLHDLNFNLSGMETQCLKLVRESTDSDKIIYTVFDNIASALCKICDRAIEQTGSNEIIFAGGVSASIFIRKRLESYFNARKAIIVFGDPKLASDNAVGTALLGWKRLHKEGG